MFDPRPRAAHRVRRRSGRTLGRPMSVAATRSSSTQLLDERGAARRSAAGTACSRPWSPTSRTPTARDGCRSRCRGRPTAAARATRPGRGWRTLMARQQPRHLVRPRRRRRGARRLRGRRPAPAVRARRAVERQGHAARSRWTAPGNNERKVIRSRNGVKITLDDTDGQERFTLETPGGQKVDAPGRSRRRSRSRTRNGNSVKLDVGGHHLTAVGQGDRQRGPVEVTAGHGHGERGRCRHSAASSRPTRVIATSVVGTSYTPGAGNIW